MQSVAAASFRARDGVAVAVHTAWGSFWTGWGILELLVATHVMPAIPAGVANPSFAFWFIALTLVTVFGALGALAQSLGLFIVLGTLTAGSAVTAAGFYAGSVTTLQAGDWLFVISAAAAWLTAGAMVLEHGSRDLDLFRAGAPPQLLAHRPATAGPDTADVSVPRA